MNTPLPRRADVFEIAEHYGISIHAVYRMSQQGCPHIKVAGKLRFDLAEVEAWLAEETAARREKNHQRRTGPIDMDQFKRTTQRIKQSTGDFQLRKRS